MLGYFLEACAKAGKELVVLDIVRTLLLGFSGRVPVGCNEVNLCRIPSGTDSHMTAGELAQMFNAERNINAKLTVVKMEGWQRGDWYDSTGLLWISPSPNLRTVNEAALYPGVGMIEGTNISVGRGTDTPFELIGAPWIKSKSWRIISMRA